MNSLIRGIGSGFGRTFGRFLFYILIGFIVYFVIKKLGINIEDYIPNIGRFILWKNIIYFYSF